jgi:hypothetical protein
MERAGAEGSRRQPMLDAELVLLGVIFLGLCELMVHGFESLRGGVR